MKRLHATGTVVLASRKQKSRIVLQPAPGKRLLVNFRDPQRFRKGELVTVTGKYSSEGFESIVINDAEVAA